MQAIRVSRNVLARAAIRQNVSARRTFIATPVRAADLVQDMYLKELKAYKPAPLKANDAEGQVQKFAIPTPPKSPEEADLQSGLQEYEQSTPEVQGASSDASAAPVEQDWFVEEEEEAEAHGH
ncbi:Putative ATP synthase, F0 complex, subunit H [Septoria linicola]|uniref:ATP synthase, F0 complex, subunit H n=1 Tax=Septoria linicola TaxID=215465 RepID=A0A9Q9B1K1_9PEZI|nr:putative ATP synthase, F0 complex, subunit H [Septoria linicola]USW55581.1 Putative ATP synthase, F0 complex, subunit H [Septoria linicola]